MRDWEGDDLSYVWDEEYPGIDDQQGEWWYRPVNIYGTHSISFSSEVYWTISQ